MVNVNTSYPDFSAGEISPRLYGRHDLKAFYSGARRVENFITEVQGGARFRTGSIYSAKTQNNEEAFLHIFNYSESLSFILEFTNTKLRFYQNDARVTEAAQNITAITKANPAVVTYSGSDNYTNGDKVHITGVNGMTEVNGNDYTVANVSTGSNTFQLSGVDSTGFTTYTSGGTAAVITEITTPYALADLSELKFSPVVNGIMYIAHPSYNPQKLTFTSATSWTMSSHSPTALTLSSNNYPAAVGVYEQRLYYAGSNNNPNRIWGSKAGDFNNFTTGTAADDGFIYNIAGSVGLVRWIIGTPEFLAIGTLEDVFQATGGVDAVITPTSISIKPTNSYGVANIMPLDKGTQIAFLQSNALTIRTFEYDINVDGYRPVDRNTIADHITSSGIKQLCFLDGRPNILWAVKNNGSLIGLTMQDEESISGWHRHSTTGDIKSIATMPRLNSYNQLWQCVARTVDGSTQHYIEYYADDVNYVRREDYVSTDGQEADQTTYENLLYENQKEYIHVDSAISYYGDVLGLDAGATLTPAATTGDDVVFTSSVALFDSSMVGRQLVRKSTTGAETGRAEIVTYTSTTVVRCEILEDFNATTAIPAGEWFLSAGTFSGLDHLEGNLVTVITDGGQHDTRTVINGTISLDEQATVVHVGLGYVGYLETNDVEGGGTTGVVQTKKKSVFAVGFRFLDTLYARYGTGYYNLSQIEMRSATMRMDRPPLMFTGDLKETYANDVNDAVEGGWAREKRVIVSQNQPFPCTVQLIIPYFNVSN